jgi:short-subunit dehydrogenase
MALNGKRVVLTGGTRGIGERVTRELKLNRADVLLIGRVKPESAAVRHLQGDLSTMEGVTAIAVAIAEEPPDILVNLAGAQYFGPIERQMSHDVHANYMVNLLAPVLLSQSVLPAMKQRGSGQIVNIGSIFGSISYPHFATYSSAKCGLRGFSEALRRELSGSGVTISYIAPRAVRSSTNTAAIRRFVHMAGMTLDEPDSVARQIVGAIVNQKKEVYIGLPERFLVRVNALLPRLIDVFMKTQTIKARSLFRP